MNKKFFDDPIVKEWIPVEIVEWMEKIVMENLKETDNEGGKLKAEHKVKHTLAVVKWGYKLAEEIREVSNNKKQALIICFLHDVGRFPQVKQNNYSDIATGIDHAGLGARMVSELIFDWERAGCKKVEIIEAIMWHNKKEYSGNNPYAKFIRGVDKLAIFEEWKEIERDANDQKQTGIEIKPVIWEMLETKRPIDDRLVETWAERILNLVSWLWNIDYSAIRREVIKMEVDQRLLAELVKNGNRPVEAERLKKNLDEFRLLAATVEDFADN
jgi:HD superfamily phosphohydrolase YqeK